jgi:DNA-directed RNA polymerase specialized sigma24 family protein
VRRLYEVHGRALLAYACAFLHDASEAEDVLHQVFLQLLRDGGTEISSAGYLFRAVRNRVLNHLRGRSREAPLDEAETDAGAFQVRPCQISLNFASP